MPSLSQRYPPVTHITTALRTQHDLNPVVINWNSASLHLPWGTKRQTQPPRGTSRKRCSRNMQQFHRRTSMLKCVSVKLLCNFIKITVRRGCSPVNLLHISRTPFHKNTFGWLLLKRGIIPFYAFQAFLLFPSTTNLASSSLWEKKLVFPDFSKIC